MVTRRGRWAALLLGALAVGGCEGGEIVVPTSEEPFLYLVLNERTVDRSTPAGRVGQHALLLTTGAASESPRYRTAERFEMRRASDGAAFAWRKENVPNGDPGSFPGVSLEFWNFHLPRDARLGADALAPGESYELLVESGGEVIRGRVTVPEEFTASTFERDGRRIAVWPRVAGAAGYRIEAADGRVVVQRDTSYVIPDAALEGGTLDIEALDPNLFTYVADNRTARAGIDRGYGVFGAMTASRIEF